MRDSCLGTSVRIKLTNVTIPHACKTAKRHSRAIKIDTVSAISHLFYYTTRMIYKHNTPIRTIGYYAARDSALQSIRYIIFEIRPTRRGAPPFPRSFEIPEIFHETEKKRERDREGKARRLIAPDICMYEQHWKAA